MQRESNIRTTARYRISDDICGLFRTERRKADANTAAQSHHDEGHCPNIRVYDTMARYGSAQEWDHQGNVTSTKPTSEEASGT